MCDFKRVRINKIIHAEIVLMAGNKSKFLKQVQECPCNPEPIGFGDYKVVDISKSTKGFVVKTDKDNLSIKDRRQTIMILFGIFLFLESLIFYKFAYPFEFSLPIEYMLIFIMKHLGFIITPDREFT